MVKRELYDIADEEFAFLVDALGKSLAREGMPHIFVGGTAVQLHVAKRLCQKNSTDIATLSKGRRLQDYLRATDDIDIALSQGIYDDTGRDEIAYFNRVRRFLEGVTQETVSPSGERVLEYRLARMGVKRPLFSIIADGRVTDEQRVMLNIGRKQEDLENIETDHYQEFVDSGEAITVPYNPQFSINARVIPITGLLATKVSNFRAKDAMDLGNLCELMRLVGEEIDYDTISKIVGPRNTKNYNKFVTLIGGPEGKYK